MKIEKIQINIFIIAFRTLFENSFEQNENIGEFCKKLYDIIEIDNNYLVVMGKLLSTLRNNGYDIFSH